MNSRRLGIAAFVSFLTLLTFAQFPGYTFLQSDTQIYMPILERFWDSSVLSHEILALRPHVSFTLYDEVALGLRHLTGLSFEQILTVQQVIFRALGILGIYLILSAMGLSTRLSLLGAAIFSLGATIGGPSVLTIEYEPVPRGYAIPLLLLAIGLAAHGRDLAAGIAASVAFLYHPPTVMPFWAVYFCLTLWPSKPAVMTRRIAGLAPILAGVVVLLFFAKLQAGVGEHQALFSRIDPFLEKLQRMRAGYNWTSMWPVAWKWHYCFLWAASMLAFWRVRKWMAPDLKFLMVGLPLIGMITVPLAHWLLEDLKWALMPQVQITRALLFVTLCTLLLAFAAAVKAAEARRYWETLLWLILVFAIPMNMRVLQVLFPSLSDPVAVRRGLVALALAVVATLAVAFETSRKRWAPATWVVAALLPFLLIPSVGRVVNYPHLDSPELESLSGWARTATTKDAVFLFPDAGTELYPGIFRAHALRAVYVDWKGGGQANFLKALAGEWWTRWQQTMASKFKAEDTARYSGLGIDYFVVRPENRLTGAVPVFENAKFVAYRVFGTITQP
jgi:hypothetical protein